MRSTQRHPFRVKTLVPWTLAGAVLAGAGCGGPSKVGVATQPEPVPPTVHESGHENLPLPENVPTSLLIATALSEGGDFRSALPYYKYAFDQDPDDVEVGARYAQAAIHVGNAREALDVLARLHERHPERLDLGLQRVRLLLVMGELAPAESLSAELVAEHPDDSDALLLRADILEGRDRPAEAAAVLGRAIDLQPASADLMVRQASLLASAGKNDEAEARLRRALELEPDNEGAMDLLAALLHKSGRADELEPLLLDLIAKTPGSSAHRTTLADLYLSQGRTDEAADLLLPLVHSGDLDWHSQLLVADLLSNVHREDEAWEIVQGLLDRGLDGPLVSRLAGEIALDRNDLDTAERYLRQAIRKDGEDVDAILSLLLVLSQREGGEESPLSDSAVSDTAVSDTTISDTGEIGRLLDRADHLVEDGTLRQNFLLGVLLRRAGREEEAIGHLERARTMDPDNEQILFDLAVCQEGTGRYRDAAKTLEHLLEIAPEDPQILNFYGYLLAEQGWELDRAEDLINRALQKEPDNAYYLDSLGWVYYQQGRHEEALDKLIDASNGLGDDPVVLEHIGDTLVALGRYEQALSIFERALAAGGERARIESRLDEVRRHLRASP